MAGRRWGEEGEGWTGWGEGGGGGVGRREGSRRGDDGGAPGRGEEGGRGKIGLYDENNPYI